VALLQRRRDHQAGISLVNPPRTIAVSADSPLDARTEKRIHGSKILIVDDEPLCCRLLAGILRRENFTNIRFAHSGTATLELVNTFQPDLVLLDMEMPDLSGKEVCQRIRTDPALVDLPILMQTATVGRREMGILFNAGASDFLSKPINPSELVSRVTVHLERRKLLRELRAYRERTSQELDAARRMQFDLLPAQPAQQELAMAAGTRIGAYSRSSSEIGGDLWGVLPISGSSFGIFLADFAGHGVTAALNTFRLHALIHEHTALHGDPVGLLEMLNERLAAVLSPGQFATFLYVVVDTLCRPYQLRVRRRATPDCHVRSGWSRGSGRRFRPAFGRGWRGQVPNSRSAVRPRLDAAAVQRRADGISGRPWKANRRRGGAKGRRRLPSRSDATSGH
jgi:DNA-binding response OmpR family regulator